jgi:putative CocE/NonD family hydrolase
MTSRRFLPTLALLVLAALALSACRRASEAPPFDVAAHYTKHEYDVPMRDGVHLHTVVYVPKNTTETYPFLMTRTPYSAGPYGEEYANRLGPTGSTRFMDEGFIFVKQDVRGRFLSEGTYRHMTPACPDDAPPDCIDESTDTYDTVEWLLANVTPNNGRVGIWGISYPGFYTAASITHTHPAIRAASPQAPIGDWFVGDDFHHRGAFYLQDAFAFFYFFESPGPNPTDRWGKLWGPRFDFGDFDNAYDFFLDMGALPNANERYFQHRIAFWDSLMTHGTYDAFWQSRNIIPHLKDVKTNVMTVAGFFDAEDPYGPLQIYHAIEANDPEANNIVVLGPWFHGGWVRSDGDHLGDVSFGQKTSVYYQENVDLPFFNHYLKDKGTWDPPEVLAYATGSNEWHAFDAWPPPGLEDVALYFHAGGRLSFDPPTEADAADAYESDPAHPVPYTQEVTLARTREYMVEDQRFVADRPDVRVYRTEPLTEDVTFAGPVTPDLFVTTTGTDADFVVKLIDVFPDDAPEWQQPEEKYLDVPMAGYQMLVRAEVFRGKFRNGFETPEPFTPGAVAEVTFDTPDVFHTFKAGHRIMVQVQSSWFPLVDRNPQVFTDIYHAPDDAFRTATHRLLRSAAHPSHLRLGRVPR